MHHCGAVILEHLFSHENGESLQRSCKCGGKFQDKKRQEKIVRTVLGHIRSLRRRQRCNRCRTWRIPEDIILDVERTGFSPGMRRIMAKTGAEVCFDKARDLISELAGVKVTDKDVERIAEAVGKNIASKESESVEAAMNDQTTDISESPSTLYIATDGTGIPVLRTETEGRKGKTADGIARSREAKLGAVFTQATTDEKGDPVRDPDSTSYTGKVESVDTFGPRLYAEAQRRGLDNAGQVVVLGDGAPWIWNLADEHFSQATQIVDFYHAKEHLADLAKKLFPDKEDTRKAWLKGLSDKLWKGRIPEVISQLGKVNVRGKKKEMRDKVIEYIQKNKKRMQYGEFRRRGLFIGSGVVEAGCKSVIGQRLKQSGMHWSVRGSNAIIALRCCIESNRFDDYWENRRAA
ncbi:MAG: ISKra4 family transposase [Planctomycetota bacterium]|jgi:hypothetical protein